MRCALKQKRCKLCIFPQKESSDFSLRITSGFCRLPFLWSAVVRFVTAVRFSHLLLAVTPLFLVIFGRLLEEDTFSVTKLIKPQYRNDVNELFHVSDNRIKDFEMLYS
jgi:hypothetical protein